MTIRLYTDSDRDRWNAYVMNSEEASCYHLIQWKDIIEKTFGHKTYYLLSEDAQGKINGILPIVNLKSMLFGNYGVSLPFFNYGGVCANDDKINIIQKALIAEAIEWAKRRKLTHIELRHTRDILTNLQTKTAKVTMTLALPRSSDELWNSFTTKLRTKIRRPSKEGMYFRVGKEDQLDSFYEVFAENMRDLGTPVYSKKFFIEIFKGWGKYTWIGSIYTKENRPVASGLIVGFKRSMEIPWASSLDAYNKYNPNALLYWNLLRFSCEQGYEIFDFGRSTPGEGTYKFKEQWGAQPTQLYWHYWMRNGGPLPELNPHNPKYRLAIKLWQKLPVSLTKLIGPSIVKNLP